MTLNITLLTRDVIFQSSDFRLTDGDTDAPLQGSSSKFVNLGTFEWTGFATYTGVGRWQRRDTSEWIVEWMKGFTGDPADCADLLAEKGSSWLRAIERANGRAHRHTFILAAFQHKVPRLWVVSNFDDVSGAQASVAAEHLRVTTTKYRAKPRVCVTGQKAAVARQERRRLERLAARSQNPAEIRRRLSQMNEAAARTTIAGKSISPECAVVSLRADGQGFTDITTDDPIEVRSVVAGMALPTRAELEKLLGFKLGSFRGAASANTGPRVPFPKCVPRVVHSESERFREIEVADLSSCHVRDLNDGGDVLGSGVRDEAPGRSLIWVAALAGPVTVWDLVGNPGAINNDGAVAATAQMTDGHEHAVSWFEHAVNDLGVFKRGKDSGATCLSNDGTVGGWVCLDPVDRGQHNFRPVAWMPDRSMKVLEDFGYDWGQAVAAASQFSVLLVAYTDQVPSALLWSPESNEVEVVGGEPGVYPMAINSSGAVLGRAATSNGDAVAVICPRHEQWKSLGTPSGWYATGMNDACDVVGATVVDGFERPWLHRATGECTWLPYVDNHWCRPASVNHAGLVAGTATADHGGHAFICGPSEVLQ